MSPGEALRVVVGVILIFYDTTFFEMYLIKMILGDKKGNNNKFPDLLFYCGTVHAPGGIYF